MTEGIRQGFYYALENGVVNIYTAKRVGPVMKTYNFGEAIGDKLHKLARGRIDLDIDEIRKQDQELNR